MTNRLQAASLPDPDFHPIATALGEAWAIEVADALRAEDREIIGAWPGTLREARMRIRLAVRTKLELELIEELARAAYLAAGKGWRKLAKTDPEA